MTKPIRELVKDKKWQKLRVSLIGKWTKTPDWCCDQLKKYLGSINKASIDKLRIVMNYLTGTAFRIGKIKSQCVLDLRQEISNELKNRKR